MDGSAAQVEAFLLSRERLGMRFGLERMCRLLARLGEPQGDFPAVHVVGTNGKSMTTLMIASALRAQGLTAGAFTSPHLLSFRERIDLGGEPVGAAAFASSGAAVRAAVEELDAAAAGDDRVTQFEAVTAIALVALAAARVDVAVVEAGLGGRLDATNVLGDSRVQVLTSVGIDHTELLGETIAQIAAEKAAVARAGAAFVCGPLGEAARIAVNRATDERDARMLELRAEDPAFAGLRGAFVRRNASLALLAAEVAFGRIEEGAAFARASAAEAIERLANSPRLPGRLQIANLEPLEIRDAAHNPQAAEAFADAVREVSGGRPVTLLVAMLGDKDVEATLAPLAALAGEDGAIVCTTAANPRALPAAELAERFARAIGEGSGGRVETAVDALAGLARAREIAGCDGVLAIAGSNYLLADLLRDRAAPPGATF